MLSCHYFGCYFPIFLIVQSDNQGILCHYLTLFPFYNILFYMLVGLFFLSVGRISEFLVIV